MNKTSHPYMVPNGDSRKDTAILLVGTADEYGLDQRSIRAVRGGFRISQELAEALGLDDEPRDLPEPDADDEPDDEPDDDEVSGNPDDADDEDDADEPVSYDDWDYADLKAEVAQRGLATEDKKSDTLIAVLLADDETRAINDASGNRAEKNTAEQE